MGLTHVPFERGQKAKHQNKQNYSGVRPILSPLFYLKVHNKPLKCIYNQILQYSFVKNSNFHGVLFLSPKGRMLTLSLPTTQHYEERESVYDAFRAEK